MHRSRLGTGKSLSFVGLNKLEKLMPYECDCGEEAKAGSFRPGHDQRLRAALEQRVGGLLLLRSIVQAVEQSIQGQLSQEALASKVRTAIERANG